MKDAKWWMGLLFGAVLFSALSVWAVPLGSVTRYDGSEREDLSGDLKDESSLSRPNKWVYEYVDEDVQLGYYRFHLLGNEIEHAFPYFIQPVRLLDWQSGSIAWGTSPKPFFGTHLACDFDAIQAGSATNDFYGDRYTFHVMYGLSAESSASYAFDPSYIEPINAGISIGWIDFAGGGAEGRYEGAMAGTEQGYCHLAYGNLLYPFLKYIGPHCFASNSVLTNVTVPEGVTDIEEGAFADCRNLTSVVLPSTLENLGEGAFSRCAALESFEVDPDNPVFKSVEGVLFTKDGQKIVAFPPGKSGTYTLPSDVETIGYLAFEGCSNTVVEIPWDNSLAGLDRSYSLVLPSYTPAFWGPENPFKDCASVRMDVPEGQEFVAPWINPALEYCTHVSLPSTWTAVPGSGPMGAEQFEYCYDLVSLEISADNPDFRSEDGVAYAKDGKTLAVFPLGRRGLFAVPEGVELIAENAFSECLLDGAIFPETLREIGYYAFGYCRNLAEVQIPASVESIGEFAFCDTGLEALSISSSVKAIGSGAFCDCVHLSEIVVDERNESYGARDGILCSKDGTELLCYPGGRQGAYTIPAHVRTLDSYAFSGVGLTSVIIPNTVETIFSSAFRHCENLVSVELPNNLTLVPDEMFTYCRVLESVNIPEGVREIGQWAFGGCSALANVEIPESVECIGAYAFHDCSDQLYDTNSVPGLMLVDGWVVGWTDSVNEDLNLSGIRGIAGAAFYYCPRLESATLDDSVTSLGASAFAGCDGLERVSLGSGVTNLADSVFAYCSQLETVTLGTNLVSIGSSAFSECSSLTHIAIPDSVTEIGSWAFSGYASLASATLPDSLATIGDCAFQGCVALTEVTIPEGVVEIGECAFDGCTSLETLRVPTSWIYAEESFWSDHAGVPEGCEIVYYGESVPQAWWSYDVEENQATVTGVRPAEGDLEIPATLGGCPVTAIGSEAFTGCEDIVSMTFPDSVTHIGCMAFEGCTGLESVVFGAGLEGIESEAFSGCTGLRNVTFSDSVAYIDSGAFSGCSALESATLPGSLAFIGDWAFQGCEALTEVTVPEGVVEIGESAFDGCTGLATLHVPTTWKDVEETFWTDHAGVPEECTIAYYEAPPAWLYEVEGGRATITGVRPAEGNLEIPATLGGCPVTAIQNGAFGGCEDIVSMTFPDSVATIGRMAFEGCTGLESVAFGTGLEIIESDAFSGCTGLTNVTLPDSVTNLGSYAFFGCTGLESAVLGAGLESIGYNAFSGCTGLTNVVIPGSVTNLEYGVFSECSRLECVTIGAGVADEEMLRWAFSGGCDELTRFLVAEDHPAWTSVDGVLFSKDLTRMIRFPCGRGGEYAVPDGVTELAERCFNDCTELTSVALPDGLVRIEDSAFSGCSGLVAVELPDSVESIGGYAFYGCEGLTEMELGPKVAEIGEGAFQGCDALERIGVDIGNPAYADEGGVLFSKDKSLLIQCPAGKGGAYTVPQGVARIGNSAFSGCGHLTAVDMGDSVESIGGYAFGWCARLESVVLGAGVREIGTTNDVHWAFASDKSLTAIDVAEDNPVFASRDGMLFSKDFGTLVLCPSGKTGNCRVPEGVERIKEWAFGFNAGLTGVELPSGLTDIGEGAFQLCAGLTAVVVPEGVTNIGYMAFADCPALASVSLPDSLLHLGNYAFGQYDDYQSEFTEELYDTTSVPGVKLVDGWAVVDWYASYPEVLDLTGVRGISDGAFDGGSFRSVILPEGLVSIGVQAFEYTSLASVAIPDSVVFIGDGAFAGCWQLEAIEVGEGNAHFASEDGVLFDKDKKRLLAFPRGKGTSYAIPDGVEAIGKGAFASCGGLTEVVLPESLKEIGREAFQFCMELKELTIPKGVSDIGLWAFWYSGLETLRVPTAWETKYVDGRFWSQYASVPDGCEIVYCVPEGGEGALPEISADSEVAEVLAAAADARLGDKLSTVGEYNDFRAWALEVKGSDGEAAGAEAVVVSEHAWASYVLGAEALFEHEPEIQIAGFGVGAGAGGTKARDGVSKTLTVRVRVKDGESIAAVDAGKVAALFTATANVLDWTGAESVACNAEAGETAEDGTMTFTVRLGDETTPRAFLGLRE